MGVERLAFALATAIVAVTRDPNLTDIYIDERGIICFRCRGTTCEDLVYTLASYMEELFRRPVVLRKERDYTCLEALDTRL